MHSWASFLWTIMTLVFIYWLATSLLAFFMLLKLFKKYPADLKPVQGIPPSWEALTRKDYSKWNRQQMLIGAFTRFTLNLNLVWVQLMLFITVYFSIFLNFITGKYKLGTKFANNVAVKLCWFVLNHLTTTTVIQDSSVPQKIDTPIIISNHVCWLDIYYVGLRCYPLSFIAKKQIQNQPLAGRICKFMKTIFVDRSSKQNQQNAKRQIAQRIEAFKNRKDIYQAHPLVIFPQGTNQNGRSLIRFKMGAFQNRSPITLFCLHYEVENFQMGQDEISQLENIILSQTQKVVLKVKAQKMVCGESESANQYMNRCQKRMGEILGYPIYDVGHSQYKRFAKSLATRVYVPQDD